MRPLIRDHEGHALKRGPMISIFGDTYWACIDCRLVGLDFRNKERATELPHWTAEDYEANKDWIEA